MRRWRGLLALVMLAGAGARAADAIEGPAEFPAYSLATVSTAVEAEGYIWLADPAETTWEANQAEPRVFQFAGHPGPHTVRLIVLNGGKPVGKYRKTVTFGGPAPPPQPLPIPPLPIPPTPVPPQPQPQPDAGFGLAAHVRDLVSRVIPATDRATGAASIAAAYRETVRLARDGKFGQPQEMIADAAARMAPARLASWSEFKLGPKLNELAKAGKIATTADVTRAFEEVALVLEAISRGQ